MWILMLKTYSGVVGLYPKGMKYDLPDKTVEQLPKGCYVKTVAPWDEQRDTSAIELAEAKKIAANNIVLVGILESAIEKAKPPLADLVTIAAQKQTESDNAQGAANAAARAAEKKDATAIDNARVFDLAHEADIKAFELEQAQGKLQTASAEGGLLQLELYEAKRAVEETGPAEGKPAEPEQTVPKTEQQPVEPEQQQAETEQSQPEPEQPEKTDGPEKTEKQKPKRKPPKKD